MTGIGFFVMSDGIDEENGIKVPLQNSSWARSKSEDLGEVLVILEPEN